MLSYLLLCLLPLWWPRSGCSLCIVHCTFVHSHIGSHQCQSLSLPPSWVTFYFKFCSVRSIGYNFHSTFLLAISFINQQFSKNSYFPVGSKQRATTMLDFENVFRCSQFSRCSLAQFNPVCSYILVCVTFQPIDFCSVPNLPHLRQFVHSFALHWLPIFFFMGWVPNKPLDFANFFRPCKHDLWRFDLPCCCSRNFSG